MSRTAKFTEAERDKWLGSGREGNGDGRGYRRRDLHGVLRCSKIRLQ